MDNPDDTLLKRQIAYAGDVLHEFQHQALIKQGIEQGKFEMALKIMETDGIEEAVFLSGFSKEELENGKLNEITPESH